MERVVPENSPIVSTFSRNLSLLMLLAQGPVPGDSGLTMHNYMTTHICATVMKLSVL